MSYSIITEKCVNCTMCELVCALDAIKLTENFKAYYIDKYICRGCGECSLLCPADAIIRI